MSNKITEEQAINELAKVIAGEQSINDLARANTRQQTTSHLTRNDWDKMASFDEMEDILDDVKGLTVLVDGLLFSHNQAISQWQDKSYIVLNGILFRTISKLEEIQIKIDYMQDVIRVK